ncbi:unnamed protein product, partial [Protopolystoma xenopodis]
MARLADYVNYEAGEASGMYHVHDPTLEVIMHTVQTGQGAFLKVP